MSDKPSINRPDSTDTLELARDVLSHAREQYEARGFDYQPELVEALYLALWSECSPLQRQQLGLGQRQP